MSLGNMHNNINSFLKKILIRIAEFFENFSTFIYRLSTEIYPYNSLNALDRQIEKLIPEILNSSTFFIEVGANNGINQSNTFFLEKKYKSKGLLIEPSQVLFEKCIKYRSRRNIFENVALVSNQYKKEFIKLVFADLMTIVDENSKRNTKGHLERSRKFYKKENYSFYAKAITLGKLLKKHNIKKVNFISIDVEGYEMNLLMGLDFSKVIIDYILVETNDFQKINNFLLKKNYKLIKKLSIHDFLFKLNSD